MTINKEKYIAECKAAIEDYASIAEKSWILIQSIAQFQSLEKGEILLREGQIAKYIYFICKGVLRAYCTDIHGNIYNKNIFLERHFAGSTVSLIQRTPSNFTIEALEDSILIRMDYRKYREFIFDNDDLKNFVRREKSIIGLLSRPQGP